jgi:hypothetical protein
MKYAAIDFETYYDADYSLKEIGVREYVEHKKFDAYLVAVHGAEIHYVGHPSKFDWRALTNYTLIAHNAAFDGLVFKRLQRDGIIPADLNYLGWVDTADLAVYVGGPRNLQGAVKELLGIEMSKVVRNKMKGKTYDMAVSAGMLKELLEYGGVDAELSYQLWMRYHEQWPLQEQRISQLNREACWRGVHVNVEALTHALRGAGAKSFPGWSTDDKFEGAEIQLFNALKKMPWADTDKPLSPDAIRRECAKCGIVMPASLAKTSEDAILWEETYAEKYPWVAAIRDFRRLSTLVSKLRTLEAGVGEDDRFSYSCKYFGAAITGRDSGKSDDEGAKFNVKNMYRKPLFGIDLRRLLTPAPGHKFIIADYAQIEARILLWRVGDKSFIDLINAEHNLYQAYAKKQGKYQGTDLKKDDPDFYQYCKTEVLSCGYQCGAARYQSVAKAQYGLDLTLAEAEAGVNRYRTTFSLVPQYWRRHQNNFQFSINHRDATHETELASGRVLTYYNPSRRLGSHGRPEMVAQDTRGGTFTKHYGGLLTGHEIQATARDVMCEAWRQLAGEGLSIPLTVYDELVFEVKEDVADYKYTVDHIQEVMKTCAPWLKGCPLDTEVKVLDYYTK